MKAAQLKRLKRGASVAANGGAVIALIIGALVLGAVACLFVDLPVTGDGGIGSLKYWVFMATFWFDTVSLAVYGAGLARANSGALAISGILFAFSVFCHAFTLVLVCFAWGNCRTTVMCSSALDPAGNVVGGYRGATSRFFGLFIMSIVAIVFYILAAIAAILSAMSLRPLKSELAKSKARSLAHGDDEKEDRSKDLY